MNLNRHLPITCGRIAQSVERWSNKPLVMGSSPIVTRFFCSLVCGKLHVAFVAERLRRYVQVVVNFVGVGSSPTECILFFLVHSWLVATAYSCRQEQKEIIGPGICERSGQDQGPKSFWRYRDSSPGQADHNRLC